MINVAIIGCGYWGPNLLRNFWGLPECCVSIACDLDQKRLDHMASLYNGLQITNNYKEVLNNNNVDAVVIATPVHTHYSLAKEFMSKGKHVFIEKPLAASSEEGSELIEIADKKDLVIMVGHTFIYSSPVRKIKEIIDSGEIGDVLYIHSRRLNLGLFQKDINVAWDLAPHDLSIILYLLGSDPLSVSCEGMDHFNTSIEDITDLNLEFPNGIFVNIQSSWLDPRKVREMTIVGTKKMILYDDTEPLEKIKIFDKRVDIPPHYDTYAEFHFSYHYGDIIIPYIKQVEPLRAETEHFLDCIENDTRCMSCGEEGLRVLKILECADMSLKSTGARFDLSKKTEM